MTAWYATLIRPPLTPPDWVFAPAWTVFYLMIAVASVLYFRAAEKPRLRLVTGIWAFHLVTNFIWTYLFFRLQSPLAALVDIVCLDLSLVAVLIFFWRANRTAGLLLIPYLLWVLFATYLNYGFYRLN